MNKRQIKLFLSYSLLLVSSLTYGQEEKRDSSVIDVQSQSPASSRTMDKKKSAVFKKTPTGLTQTRSTEKKIWFKFKDEPLQEIINYVANAMPINVVLPQGQDALTVKATFQFPQKITLTEAYEKVLAMLKTVGYSIVPQNDFHYIVKNDQTLAKQPFPLYVNTAPIDLPDTDQVIRYMYYFANIQVPSGSSNSFGGAGGNALQTLLQDTLPKTATMIFDSGINGMVIIDYARNIRAIMEIVVELDSHGFTDSIEIIPLKHTNAATIATLFKTLISQTDPSAQGGGGFGQIAPQTTSSSSSYFAPTTRIVPELRTNSLIVMGKKDALKRVHEFLEKYVDIPLDDGNSILHIYPLQYLIAKDFAPILQNIVTSQGGGSSVGGGLYGGSSGQSSSTSNPMPGKQYFKGVIIAPEVPTAPNASTANSYTGASSSTSGAATPPAPAPQGGNRLIIAALRDDWARLKKLIADLDTPQPQVAIEILIVDLTLTGGKFLGSQIRNKEGMFPSGVNAQTSMLGGVQLGSNAIAQNAFNALMGNLLQLDSSGNNIASNATGGSFILSVQDNPITGIAWIVEALQSYTNAKILSHPFCVTLNNQPTTFTDQQTLLLPGSATVKKGATFAPISPVTAALSVAITPQINGDSFINLGVNIVISEFANANSQINRAIQTNANVRNGQVLVLGGLTKTTNSTTDLGTPLLERIPIVGWMFKSKSTTVTKSNLAVFICPTILESTSGYTDPFTTSKFLAVNKAVNPTENFGSLKDPITRWFFNSQQVSADQERIDDFINSKPFMNKSDYQNLKMSHNKTSSVKRGKFVPVPSIRQVAQTEKKELTPTQIVNVGTAPEKSKETILVSKKAEQLPALAQTLPQKTRPILQGVGRKLAATPSKKESNPTIILSKENVSEQDELKRLFAQLGEQSSPMPDSTTQRLANLL